MMQPGVYVTLDELVREGLRAKGFSFLPRGNIHSLLSGRHASKFRGRGMDFAEMKRYALGDDTRLIDWKATRRTGKPFVRVFNEERDRSVWVVVSQRNSMFFGSRRAMKSVQAAHAAALALFRVIDQGDRVGGAVFNDTKLRTFKPERSRRRVMQMLGEIVRQNHALDASQRENNMVQFNHALSSVAAAIKHDDLLVLIGDGLGMDEASVKTLESIARHNDILAVHVSDPMERDLTVGALFSDAETFLPLRMEPRTRQRYAQSFASQLRVLESLGRRNHIALLTLTTEEEVLPQLQRALGTHR